MKNQIKVSQTRYPRLARAVLRRVNREGLVDVCNNGADAGFNGFTYYAETNAFLRAHKSEILALAKDCAEGAGTGMIEMIARFRCLSGDYSQDEIGEAIYSGRDECALYIRNALAWFALEEIARELNTEL